MDGESEGLRRQVTRLDLTIQAEMEKGKVLQVCQPHFHPHRALVLCLCFSIMNLLCLLHSLILHAAVLVDWPALLCALNLPTCLPIVQPVCLLCSLALVCFEPALRVG